ncbi:MAG: hypothetical protein A3E87_04420 [Gammaproteobacteria bacterium RIFCSPHIGHO2_12_FULL_35_23]|nr:MAG: hypothetical protein A3E87_04420 [Gammaproteobacteria bacterium RIFCSPHIGHO2_12_FULL_35_23]
MKVKAKILRLLGITGALFFIFTRVQAVTLTPVGYWQQISDTTNKIHSIVQIWEENNQLKGKVVRGFGQNGQPPKEFCTNCPTQFNNQPIVGMTIMWGMQYNPNHSRWEGGQILDPDTGNIYKANMTLINGGQRLSLRGYIGIPLLGRSQTWLRIPPNQVKQELSKNWQPQD